MDHEVVSWRCKSVDWLLNLSGTTLVHTKEQMAHGPQRLRSSKYNFQCLVNAMTWSNKFCGERGKRGGMVGKGRGSWQRNAFTLIFYEFFLGALYTNLPTIQGSQGTFFSTYMM